MRDLSLSKLVNFNHSIHLTLHLDNPRNVCMPSCIPLTMLCVDNKLQYYSDFELIMQHEKKYRIKRRTFMVSSIILTSTCEELS